MIKYVPNALSLSRIPLSVALFIAAWHEMWESAAIFLVVALLTDALDGWVARHYNVESDFGADVLEPACDLALSVAAVAGLWLSGEWPLWVPITLAALTVLLQAAHSTPWLAVRRHAHWIHPIFFIAVIFWVGAVIVDLAFADDWKGWLLLYSAAWAFIVLRKRERWMDDWIHGDTFKP